MLQTQRERLNHLGGCQRSAMETSIGTVQVWVRLTFQT